MGEDLAANHQLRITVGWRSAPGTDPRSPVNDVSWPSLEALPPTARVYRDPLDGTYRRNVPRPLGGADLNGRRVAVYELEPRPVALSLAEAREKGHDFYHPERGWIRDGRKPEREPFAPPVSEDPPTVPNHEDSVELREFRRRGGIWPPQQSWWEECGDLEERRECLTADLRWKALDRDLARALGAPRPAKPSAQEREIKAHLRKIERAIAAIQKSASGARGEDPEVERRDIWATVDCLLEDGRPIDRHELGLELGLSPHGLSKKLKRAGLTMAELKNRRRQQRR